MGSTPWVRRHPGVGSGNPFQYSYLENSTVRESVQSEVLDMTEHTRRQHTLDLLLKANCFHVFWLLILFHSLFITAQSAASNLFGDSAVGEYFRAFLSYGVIAIALVIYAWRGAKRKKGGIDLTKVGKE